MKRRKTDSVFLIALLVLTMFFSSAGIAGPEVYGTAADINSLDDLKAAELAVENARNAYERAKYIVDRGSMGFFEAMSKAGDSHSDEAAHAVDLLTRRLAPVRGYLRYESIGISWVIKNEKGQNAGNGERMDKIGFTAFSLLSLMCLFSKMVGLGNQVHICLRMIFDQNCKQLLKVCTFILRHVPLLFRPQRWPFA